MWFCATSTRRRRARCRRRVAALRVWRVGHYRVRCDAVVRSGAVIASGRSLLRYGCCTVLCAACKLLLRLCCAVGNRCCGIARAMRSSIEDASRLGALGAEPSV